MIFRNKQQLALNEVEIACMKAAGRYALAAEKIQDVSLVQSLIALSLQRRELGMQLAMHIKMLDDLPQPPDPDKETMANLATQIKLLFVSNERNQLLEECEHIEQEIEKTVLSALAQQFPVPTRMLLERIVAHVATAKAQLAGLHQPDNKRG